jgi:hypothetical protein
MSDCRRSISLAENVPLTFAPFLSRLVRSNITPSLASIAPRSSGFGSNDSGDGASGIYEPGIAS